MKTTSADTNVEIPDYRPDIRTLLDELRTERLGRPSVRLDDNDLIDGIEDLLDIAFEDGVKAYKNKRSTTSRSLEKESLL